MNERTEKKGAKANIPPELVAEARGGDQAAFAELYERTNAALYRSIRSMVRDEDLAWDILQDSYLRAYQGLDKLEADGAFLPWLRRIAVNETARQMSKRLPVSFSELGGEDGEDWEPEIPDLNLDSQPEPALDRKETARLVREILAELPEGQQMILGMRYYEDMSVKEIAGTLHIAPGSVRAQLFQGRKKVEARVRALEKQGVKLYGLGPIPFLVALLRKLEPAEAAEQKALAAVLSKAAGGAAEAAAGGAAGTAAKSAAAAAAGEAAAETAVNMTVMTAGQAFLHGLSVKLLAGVFAVALVGGLWAGNRLLKEHRPAPEEPSVVSTEAPAVPTQPTGPEDETAPPRRELVGNECGAEGDNLTWRFDEETGTLIIEGSGAMADFSSGDDNLAAPWLRQVAAYIGNTGNSIIISLPDGLSRIGNAAFYLCHLESLVIPESVTSIGDSAFFNCYGLSSLTIPAGVTSIGKGAFAYSCESGIDVAPENPAYSSDSQGILFNKDMTELLHFPSAYTESFYTVPDTVSSIGDRAFYACSGLNALTLPDGLTVIGDSAFSFCEGLKSLVLPDSLAYIGFAAFKECNGLSSLTLPDSVTSIGDNTFEGCTGLSSLKLPDGLTVIGDSAFSGCSGLSSLKLPDGLTSIGDNAFWFCSGLSSLKLPDSLTSIGNSAFSYCTGLSSLTLPDGLTSIGDEAFDGCFGLSSLKLPDSLTFIGKAAFRASCASGVYVSPNNPAYSSDSQGVLFNKNKIELFHFPYAYVGSYTVPDSVISIGDSAFYLCSGLNALTFPDGLTSIGDRAFYDCSGLSSLTLPDGLTSIGDWAFFDCDGLSSLTIPAGVSSFGERIFDGCPDLTLSVYAGSAAEAYAEEHGIPFVVIEP